MIRKYLYGGPGYFLGGITAKDLDEGTKKVARGFNWLMGKVGDAFNTVVTSGASSDFGQTSPFALMNRKAVAKGREQVRQKAKKAIEENAVYVSPSSHVAAWTQGSWNPKVGALFLASDPRLQTLGAVGDLAALKYTPKAVKVGKNLSLILKKRSAISKVNKELKKGIKENSVLESYNEVPANKDIGTVYDYLDFLDNIYPNSKLNATFYHGGPKGITQFKTAKELGSTNKGINSRTKDYGIYLIDDKSLALYYSRTNKKANRHLYNVRVNVQNPMRYETNNWYMDKMSTTGDLRFRPGEITLKWYDKLGLKDYDGIYHTKSKNAFDNGELVILDGNNIHIMGTPEESLMFRNWKLNPLYSSKPLLEEIPLTPEQYDRSFLNYAKAAKPGLFFAGLAATPPALIWYNNYLKSKAANVRKWKHNKADNVRKWKHNKADNVRKWKHNKGGIFKALSGLKFYNTKLNYNPNIQPLFIKLIQPFVNNQRNPVVNLHVVRFNPETGDAENNVGEGYSLALPELTVYGDNMKEKMSHVPYQLPEPESTWALMGKHSKDAEKYWSPEYGWLVFNTMTLGAPNRLSVSLDLRFIKDLFNPKLTATQKADSWVLGNEGIFENPLYNMALDMASGAGIEGAILHISSKPTLYRNLYRKGIKQLTAKERLNNLIDKAQLLKDNIDLVRRLYSEIVDKVIKELVPLVTRDRVANPVNLNINPNKLKLVWQKIHPDDFSGEEIKVTNIDGKPTAYVVNQAYNPNTIVNTGKYRIPNFNTGEYIEGNLNLNSSDETITTAAGKIIPTGLGSRNILGVAPLRLVLNDNYNFVVQHIPGFKGFGSSVGVKEGALNHITHDIDGYISKENLDEFAKTHNINKGYSDDTFWYELNNGLYGDAGHIDLNVIDINPKTGVGNARAKELYRQFFPKEYRHSVERSASDPNHEIYITDLNNVPLTNLQLIDKFDPLTKTIMDSFEIDFDDYYKAKHAGRALEYLAGDNPKAVRKALEQTAKELSLNGEIDALLPTMKFDNIDENIKVLNQIGYKGDLATIAKNPLKMQNVLDYWALTKGKTFNRAFGPGNIDEEVGTAKTLNRNAIEWNYTDKDSGGHAAGAFLNTIRGSKPLNDNKYMSILIPHVDLPLGVKANDIIDKVQYANGTQDVLIKDKSQLSEILQKSFKNTGLQLDILNTPNLTFKELLNKLPSSGEEVNNFGKLFNLKFHVNAIQGDTYNNYYSGVIAPMNNPKDSYSLFYRFHGLPDWDSRMQRFDNANNVNPFDILRNHLTKRFYIGMTRNQFKDINRENRYRELLQQIWDNQWTKNLKYNAATNILDKRIRMAKNKINDIAYKKRNTKKNIKNGLVASSFPTGIASLVIIANLDLDDNLVNSPRSKALDSYYKTKQALAKDQEAFEAIFDEWKELLETLEDSYKQLKKLIDLAKAKIPRNKYGTPKFDSPEYLTWKRLLQIAIQEGYLPEDYVPDYNFE